MNILSAQEIKEWDEYTMQHEPIASIDLMERAAQNCKVWISEQNWSSKHFQFFCGKGNNGGDGLAIARLLLEENYLVSVFITEKEGSENFHINLNRLEETMGEKVQVIEDTNFPLINSDDILIDALFGSGLNQPLDDFYSGIINSLNQSGAIIISIDMPSGLFADISSKGKPAIHADHVLTLQCYKTGLLVQENGPSIGEVHVIDIGLKKDFLQTLSSESYLIDLNKVRKIYKKRNAFAHKGTFGHALLIAGSYGKIGAAVLAAKACIRSGSGLLTACIPKCGYIIMQSMVPEAMVITDEEEKIVAQLPDDIEKYSVVAIGPGMGTAPESQKLLSFIIRRYKKKLVLDADGLNCLALQKNLLRQLPAYSILTPHPKEFDRLFGDHANDFDRIKTAALLAKELQLIIVLKGHHTLIATPEGKKFFNTTGNPGMAKGGSGDVLTGIITGLAAQQYEPLDAAIMGVYLHGLAGDFAAKSVSQESMTAGDIIDFLSRAFLEINNM